MNAALQLLLTVSIPSLMVLVGILVNRNDANRLDRRIDRLEDKMDAMFERSEDKMGTMFERLEAKFEALHNEMIAHRTQSHAEFLLLLGRDAEIDKRLTDLERKQSA